MSIISIRGERSTGKSTFAATWPGRKWWLDYERGAKRALDAKDKDGKPRFPEWEKTVALWNPADDPAGIALMLKQLTYTVRGAIHGQSEMWDILIKKFDNVIPSDLYECMVLDTARLVWRTNHHGHLQFIQEGAPSRQTLASIEYATPNARMEGLFIACQAMNKDLILINHERPIYIMTMVDGKNQSIPDPSGKTELDGFNKTLNYADWGFVSTYTDHSDPADKAQCITDNKKRYGGCPGFHFHVQIEKSPIGAEFRGKIIDAVDYPTIKTAIEKDGGSI